MIKRFLLPLLIVLIPFFGHAKQVFNTDTLINILKIDDETAQKKQLLLYLRNFFAYCPIDELTEDQTQTNNLLFAYDVDDKEGLSYFIGSVCASRVREFGQAERLLVKAIIRAKNNKDHYLLYTCYTHLAFIKTFEGNIIDAVANYRLARQEALTLSDPYLQVVIAINISDIFYRNGLYIQSLSYLDQAQSVIEKYNMKEQRLQNVLWSNKADDFFRLADIDSLKRYHELLAKAGKNSIRAHSFSERTDYYIDMIEHNYADAINKIIALKNDNKPSYNNDDALNLADAYYFVGKPDSVRKIVNDLLKGWQQHNHPEVKLHLYELLGDIDELQQDTVSAARNYQYALEQSKEQLRRLTLVDTLTSLIRLDDLHGVYQSKVASFQRERILLLFVAIASVLVIVTGAAFYRNLKQKRYYERLLYTSQKEELAFINSHEVRRHLSNILGIIDMIKSSDNKHEEYLQAEDYLLESAEDLDNAIKNFSAKLDD